MVNSAQKRNVAAWASILLAAQLATATGAGAAKLGPVSAADINNDPNIVEVELTATETEVELADGTETRVWTYNGHLPGPLIEGKVGDTLIVNFTNDLTEPTTIHWHGLELPAEMDGSNIAQLAVEPGGTFRYEFVLKDASTFWYHSHIDSNAQVEMGLAGALVVRDPAEDEFLGLPTKREHVLVLDDILLDETGQVAEPFPADPIENAITHVNGRIGDILLVNGHVAPNRGVKRGEPLRLRLVNVSNSRFMRLSIPGHTLYQIGGDGGLLETPVALEPIGMVPAGHGGHHMVSDPDLSKGLLLTPGERADVVFTPNGDGKLALQWHDMPRGKHTAFYKPDGGIGLGHAHDDGAAHPKTLMTFNVAGGEDGPEYVPPLNLRTIDRIDVAGAEKIVLEFGHTRPNQDGDITFFAQRKNGMGLPFWNLSPEDAPKVEVGETRIIEVRNLTGGDHNFHLHGFFVQPLEIQYKDMDNPENNFVVPFDQTEMKDTIHLPRRPGAAMRSQAILRLAVRFDDTGREGDVEAFGKEPDVFASGGWVMHCHILEHADRGMMSFVQVYNQLP